VASCCRPTIAWSVCQSVCYTSEPCKNSWTNRDAVWLGDLGGSREPRIRWWSRSPHGKGQFWGGKPRPIVNCSDTAVISAKTAEPIEIPFGFWNLWARMGPRNHVLDGSPEVLRDVAMANNFGTKIAISGFVWTIATRQLVIGRGFETLSGRPTKSRYCRYLAPKWRCHGNHFFAFSWV